jgi:hypothetical protein
MVLRELSETNLINTWLQPGGVAADVEKAVKTADQIASYCDTGLKIGVNEMRSQEIVSRAEPVSA